MTHLPACLCHIFALSIVVSLCSLLAFHKVKMLFKPLYWLSNAVHFCRDSLLASLLDGVRASGNRDVCVKMAPTQRGQRWGLLSMPVDEEVESLHLKFLAAPPSESEFSISKLQVYFF